MSARFPSRFDRLYTCLECGKLFHPWYTSVRKYCSTTCAGRAKQAAAVERWNASHDPYPPEFLRAWHEEAVTALARLEAQLADIEKQVTRPKRQAADK